MRTLRRPCEASPPIHADVLFKAHALQATAAAVWKLLHSAPGLEERPTGVQRVTLATFLRPHRRVCSMCKLHFLCKQMAHSA